VVVYNAHGVGRVIAREQRLIGGAERDCILVELAGGMRVTLPLDTARERLRAVCSKAELASVQKTLAEEPSGRDSSWTRRIKESKAKLAGGRAVDLAELVRDGARCEDGEKGLPRLSPGERSVYLQARQLLVREISSAQGVEQAQAENWIAAQLPPRGGT
jgi:RNA polymerase-interacting CarD/CdnL/TRCF family regulator